MTAWTLAHNLAVRVAAIRSCWPQIVIGEIGDQAHASEAGGSDHNPDSRGIVHAIDVMTYGDETRAAAVLAWLAAGHTDLEYWIHDRKIWEIAHNFVPHAYTGSDPHTDHVHISGLHGSTGECHATGTGYSTTAEAMAPAGTPCSSTEDIMDLTAANLAAIADAVWTADTVPNWRGDAKANPTIQARNALGYIGAGLPSPATLAAAVVAALPKTTTGTYAAADIETALVKVLATATAPDAS